MNVDVNQGLKQGAFLRHDTYRIEKVLGQGGFGITYLAMDLSLDRFVAIKEFFPKDYCDRNDATSHVTLGTQSSFDFVNKLKSKFLKEARNIARFDNPNIIRIHSAFEENDTAYYVMDYIEGKTLAEIVRQSGPIAKDKAITYLEKIGEALEYVHKHNITHLDIKPANIMIRTIDERPILIDFGLAKQYDSNGLQTSTTPVGISHGYAPIEQYSDGGIKEFSPQTDQYSLAATLYYILSGVTPPHATKLIEDELTFPQTIPAQLIGPISKAMSASRKKRYENVGAFIKDLKLAIDGCNASSATITAKINADTPIKEQEPVETSTSIKAVVAETNEESGIDVTTTLKNEKTLIAKPSDNTEISERQEDITVSHKGAMPKWVYVAAAIVVIAVCIGFFLPKKHTIQNVNTDQAPITAAERFNQALALLDSDSPESVKSGFKTMNSLAMELDDAKIEIGLTYFPYLTAKSDEETMANPILKRRHFLKLNSRTDADSVVKYLGSISNLPPEAAYILGCTYYQKYEDEKQAVKMFRQAKVSLDNGMVAGHGYDSKKLLKILEDNIHTLQ
ncbi:MAG: serine/threonine protein kinase [Muribaculaceae bacterium]|nr:serine/threonine protein kinase [Muribaculaceae bacterium]